MATAPGSGEGILAESLTFRLVELLLSGTGKQSLPCSGPTCLPEATPVAVCEAKGAGPGNLTLPRRVPVSKSRAHKAGRADAQLLVGEGVIPCPKAGCGKSARPV